MIMKDVLVDDRQALLAEHIRTSVLLPKEHPVRRLFVQACVKKYVRYLSPLDPDPRSYRYLYVPPVNMLFRFQTEMDELLYLDVLREYGKAMRGRMVEDNGELIDPLSGQILKTCWSPPA